MSRLKDLISTYDEDIYKDKSWTSPTLGPVALEDKSAINITAALQVGLMF